MLYINCLDLKDYNNSGVTRKINGQIDSFNHAGLNCAYYHLPSEVNRNSIMDMIKRRLPYINIHTHWNLTNVLLNEKTIYIRQYIPLDMYIVDFFIKLKRRNPDCKIVWELPTYPYDEELRKIAKHVPFYIKDKYNRRKLNWFVDRIATLTNVNEIFGIKTVHIQNGADFRNYTIKHAIKHISDVINMIAVSTCWWWHGYDRFIEGLGNYYANGGKRNIVFHLVGDGTELSKYRELTAKYELDSHVIFHGMQSGGALDEVYDQCSLGIGSLGAYRKGLNDTAELKTREYLAKGIAFICSAHILDIDSADEKDIYLRVPNNDSPIDIPSILAFYDRIYQEPETQVIARLRKYAEDHFSMDAAMKEVIDYFKSEEV